MTSYPVNFKGFPFPPNHEAVKRDLVLDYISTVNFLSNLSKSDIFIKIHLLKMDHSFIKKKKNLNIQ